jgi:hypothetical protein
LTPMTVGVAASSHMQIHGAPRIRAAVCAGGSSNMGTKMRPRPSPDQRQSVTM